MANALVDAEWLWQNRDNKNLIVLYTRMADLITGEIEASQGKIILDARLFDFETEFCDLSSPLPHTLPSTASFTRAAQKLGINQKSVVVVYDSHGIYASPRVWWMLKSFGHEQVFVLNGGLPAWVDAGYQVSDELKNSQTIGDFVANPLKHAFVNKSAIQKSFIENSDEPAFLFDARSTERFNGVAAEPRRGVRSGHIPGSYNIPFQSLLKDGKLISPPMLQTVFTKYTEDFQTSMTFSCGSGVTACILALAAYNCGYQNLHVYDGSWTEWGSDTSLPIATEE